MQGQFRSLRLRVKEAARSRLWLGLNEKLSRQLSLLLRTVRGKAAIKRLRVVIPVAALLGTVSYWHAPSAPAVKASALFEVKKGDFTSKITELGELRALESVTVSAQKDLPIIYLVPEGIEVKKGDVLVRLDPSKEEAALEESNAALQVAQAELQKAEKDLEAQRQRLLAEIARFEAEVRLAQLDLADLKKKPLKGELDKVRMELERAKAAFDNAEKNRNLLPELVEKGFIKRSTLEEAELTCLEAKANLQVARFNFETVSAGATQQELERAGVRLEQAKFALEKAQSGMQSQLQSFAADVDRQKANMGRANKLVEGAKVKLKRAELRAPRDGLVVYAKVRGDNSSERVQLGMIPFEGQPILYLPDVSSMVVDTEVNEIDIGRVQMEGPVEVRLDAYPGVVFHGQVLKIGSLAKLKQSRTGTASGIKIFDVTVKIEEQDPRLKPGLTATLDIITDHQADVIAIPLSAVVARGREHVVFVANAGKITERTVVLGPSNEQSVIVAKGLRPGEQVALVPLPAGPS